MKTMDVNLKVITIFSFYAHQNTRSLTHKPIPNAILMLNPSSQRSNVGMHRI